MKDFLTSIVIVVFTLIFAAVTSLLLDWVFIQAHYIRQLLVYLLIVLEFFIGVRLFLMLNYKD